MAEISWTRSLTNLFKKKAVALSPESCSSCLEFSRQCLEEVRTMTLPRASKFSKFINYEQCIYLSVRLANAVHKASLFLELKRHNGKKSLFTEDVRENTLELLKILCMLANKVKCFIQGCRIGHWLRMAVMLTNLSDCTASLGFDLKLFTILLSPYGGERRHFLDPLTIDEVSVLMHIEGELVNRMESDDELSWTSRVMELKSKTQSGLLSRDDLELATFLLERRVRLKQSSRPESPQPIPPERYLINLKGLAERRVRLEQSSRLGSPEPILPERDLTNLKDLVQIGRGGCGTVHKASWLGIDVAVKTFYGTDNPEFNQEVQILASLSHLNIVSFLFHGKDIGECCIVMELMDRDLFSLMKQRLRSDRTRSSPFSVFEEFDVMLQIAEAMDYLHEMRVLHRDLKAQNILVRCMNTRNVEGYEFVQVKVSDFGLSRTKEFSMTRSHMTPNMGTARWMAPELITFRNTNDPILDAGTARNMNYPFKCDTYSFGMVCLEILTGAVPFPNMTPNEVKIAVCAGERPQLPDRCHKKLKTLIENCWSPNANSRPCFGDICAELMHLKSLLMKPTDFPFRNF